METYQSKTRSLPVLILDVIDGVSGLTGKVFDTVGLTVKYKKNGGTVQTYTLTADNWHEDAYGCYTVDFSGAILDTLGTFLYWCACPNAIVYPGAVDIVVDPVATIVAGLLGATVSVTSSVTPDGQSEIVRGATYTDQLHFDVTNFPDLTGYTGKLNCKACGIIDKPATIVAGDVAGSYIINVPYSGALTALLTLGQGDYTVSFTKTDDETILPVRIEGIMIVKDWRGI